MELKIEQTIQYNNKTGARTEELYIKDAFHSKQLHPPFHHFTVVQGQKVLNF